MLARGARRTALPRFSVTPVIVLSQPPEPPQQYP